MFGWWIQFACWGWNWSSDVKLRGSFLCARLEANTGFYFWPLCWEALISEHYLDAFQLFKFIVLYWQLFGFNCCCSTTHFYGAIDGVLLTQHPFPSSPFSPSKQTNKQRQIASFKCIWLLFPSGEVKTLMIQLLRGVKHLHDNWILHRDLKTSNLLLSHSGILKVRISWNVSTLTENLVLQNYYIVTMLRAGQNVLI